MKKIILLSVITLLSITSFAQTKINEQDAIKKTHIDFNNEYLFFTISGLVEIDGHTFLNDTCKDPIVYEATINEIRLHNKTTDFTHRKCEAKGCKIIHLTKLEPIFSSTSQENRYYFDHTLCPFAIPQNPLILNGY